MITSNSAIARGGGGIYFEYSSSIVKNCIIKDNSATGDSRLCGGGGIFCEMSHVTIINSHIEQNSANSGGGVYCHLSSSLTINNCTISNNLAKAEGSWGTDRSYGGGVCCHESSSLTITGSTISDNIAEVGDSAGGGVYGRDSKLTIDNCTITGNTVKGDWNSKGGGIYCEQGSSIIAKCKINNNSATEGGGIACEQSSPIITGSIISGNFGPDRYKFGGGGIYCDDSSPTIANCTIIGNSFFGLYCHDGSTNVTNSILYYNGRDGRNQIDGPGYVNVNYSDVQTHKPSYPPWPGEGNINADPCFIESGYWDANGTPYTWEDDFWVEGNYRLLPTSPCIDAGCPTSYLLDTTDLDGNPRIVNGRIDMGAYEAGLPAVEVEVNFTPEMLNCGSEGRWVKAHVTFPEEIYPEDINVNTPAVADPPGVESEFIEVFESSRGRFDVQIYFERESFCEALSESEEGSLEVTVTGSLLDGRKFEGSDTIGLRARHWRRRNHKDRH